MSTLALQRQIERDRFARHAFETLTGLPRLVQTVWARAAGARADAALAERAARDAQRVRALASRYQPTDPGFAADLYAAAARHEGCAVD